MAEVSIGENAVIGALSLVNQDIPANAVAVGVPAKVVREIEKQSASRLAGGPYVHFSLTASLMLTPHLLPISAQG